MRMPYRPASSAARARGTLCSGGLNDVLAQNFICFPLQSVRRETGCLGGGRPGGGYLTPPPSDRPAVRSEHARRHFGGVIQEVVDVSRGLRRVLRRRVESGRTHLTGHGTLGDARLLPPAEHPEVGEIAEFEPATGSVACHHFLPV